MSGSEADMATANPSSLRQGNTSWFTNAGFGTTSVTGGFKQLTGQALIQSNNVQQDLQAAGSDTIVNFPIVSALGMTIRAHVPKNPAIPYHADTNSTITSLPMNAFTQSNATAASLGGLMLMEIAVPYNASCTVYIHDDRYDPQNLGTARERIQLPTPQTVPNLIDQNPSLPVFTSDGTTPRTYLGSNTHVGTGSKDPSIAYCIGNSHPYILTGGGSNSSMYVILPVECESRAMGAVGHTNPSYPVILGSVPANFSCAFSQASCRVFISHVVGASAMIKSTTIAMMGYNYVTDSAIASVLPSSNESYATIPSRDAVRPYPVTGKSMKEACDNYAKQGALLARTFGVEIRPEVVSRSLCESFSAPENTVIESPAEDTVDKIVSAVKEYGKPILKGLKAAGRAAVAFSALL
jgi:hypothetical protein